MLHRSPDDAKIKQKMLFASSKDALKRSLVGLAVEIQGSDPSEVCYEAGAYGLRLHCTAGEERSDAIVSSA